MNIPEGWVQIHWGKTYNGDKYWCRETASWWAIMPDVDINDDIRGVKHVVIRKQVAQ